LKAKSRHAVLARLKVVSDKKNFPVISFEKSDADFWVGGFQNIRKIFFIICLGSDRLNVLACGSESLSKPTSTCAIEFRVQCYGLTNHGRRGLKCD
jgi:hypothetical protein